MQVIQQNWTKYLLTEVRGKAVYSLQGADCQISRLQLKSALQDETRGIQKPDWYWKLESIQARIIKLLKKNNSGCWHLKLTQVNSRAPSDE